MASDDDDSFWSRERVGSLVVVIVAGIALWIQAKHGEVNPDTVQTFVEGLAAFMNPESAGQAVGSIFQL